MNDYIELRVNITPCDEIATDILAALLAEGGYESFVPDATGLTAYIPQPQFDREETDKILRAFPLPGHQFTISVNAIEGEDWNSEWEKHYFQPIVVADKCVIHSSFHKNIPACQYDIVIDPKMAFGTGHHATTSLIMNSCSPPRLRGRA